MGEVFKEIAFGPYGWGEHLGVQFLAFVGFLLMAFINYVFRTNKERKPSPKYWFIDNWVLCLALVFTIYLGLRFQIDLIGRFYKLIGIEAAEVSDKYFAFPVVGFGFRAIIHQLNKLVKKWFNK